jgi:hypothetical protein
MIFYKTFFFHFLYNKVTYPMANYMHFMDNEESDTFIFKAVQGGIAAFLSQIILYPLDLIKTKQLCEIAPKAKCSYKRFFWSFKYIISS